MRDIFFYLVFIAIRIKSGHCCQLSNKCWVDSRLGYSGFQRVGVHCGYGQLQKYCRLESAKLKRFCFEMRVRDDKLEY